MANIGKWNTPSSIVSILTTELNSLTTNTMASVSAVVNNDTNLDMYGDLELNLGTLSPTAGGYVAVYIAEAADGTNYPAPSSADQRLQTNALLCTFALSTTATTAQRLVCRNVLLPPGKFKLYLDNQSGATMNASGNTLKLLPYNTNLNG